MTTETSKCLYDLNFNHLAYYAHKHYIEGVQTIELMEQAGSDREKEEIALVALLDVQGDMNIVLSQHQSQTEIGRLSDLKRVLRLHIQVDNLSEWLSHI